MKTLIALFLLIAASAFGANPDYKVFRGAGGITVTTNPPTGTIVIDGSGVVASGTNSSMQVSTNNVASSTMASNINFTAGTNLVLRGTNIGSTSHINYRLADSVGLAGTLGVSGAATFNQVTFGGPTAFNDEATFNAGIVIPAGAVNGYVWTTDAMGNGAWSSSGGGTNVPIGQTLYLDATFGNDATAGRTNLLRPYKQASNAVSMILSGDTLVVRGGTNLIYAKSNSFPQTPSSAGLAITNKSNFRITGEPGSVWKMGAQIVTGGTNSCPMMVLSECTNVVMENLTLVGIRTNGVSRTLSHAAVFLRSCENVTFNNVTFQDWSNQGVTDFNDIGRNITFRNCKFINCGGTNHWDFGGGDGSAISVSATNLTIVGCTFFHNYRSIELCCGNSTAGFLVKDNTFISNYYQHILLEGAAVNDGQILNNRAFGYAQDLPINIPEASFIEMWSVSNILVQGNFIFGMSGVSWSPAAGRTLYDVKIWDNTFADSVYRAVLLRSAGAGGIQDRTSIKRNVFRETFYEAIDVSGNNTSIENNEYYDCGNGWGTSMTPQGVICAGWYDPTFATNSTNITIIGNKIMSSVLAGYPAATGIVIYATCKATVVHGNSVDTNYYVKAIFDQGVGTKTRPVNLVAPGSLLRTDASGDERAVTIGAGVAFDGTTLTGSGGGGSVAAPLSSFQYNSNGVQQGSQMYFNPTNGNVGIGTATPASLLQMTKSGSGGLGPELIMENPSGVGGDYVQLTFMAQSSGVRGRIRGVVANNAIAFDSATTEIARITATGLGIGTTTPTNSLDVTGNTSLRSNLWSSGHHYFLPDNTYDIGASGATRPRNLYVAQQTDGGSFKAAASATSGYNMSSRFTIAGGGSDGTMLLLDFATGLTFNRLQLGGTTAAFPAIGRAQNGFLGDLVILGADGVEFGSTNRVRVPGGIVMSNSLVGIGKVWTATNLNGSGTWSNAPAGGGSSFAGHSNAIPFVNPQGTALTYYDTGNSLTNPGFGFDPRTLTGPHGGYAGLMVYANSPMGLVTIGHPNPGSDFSTLATALVVSNRYNGAADFKNDMIKFDAVMVGGGLRSDSTMTRWRVWQGTTSSNDVAEITIDGTLKLATAVNVGVGSGLNGKAAFYDTLGTNFQFEAVTDMDGSNVFYRLPLNNNPGVMVAVPIVLGLTNQMTNITLTAGQVVSHNGTTYVAKHELIGVTNGSDAAAGDVGEYVLQAFINKPVGADSTYYDMTNIVLTPGDWQLSASCYYAVNGGTWASPTFALGILPNSGTSTVGAIAGDNFISLNLGTSGSTVVDHPMSIPMYRFNTPTNVTLYMKGFADYTTGTPVSYGKISALRMR